MKLSEYVKIMGIDLREPDETPDVKDLRIVENKGKDFLEQLDEDTQIMDVPLNLNESCVFDFDKHIDAIICQESDALQEHEKKYTKLNSAQENAKEYDRRFKERPGNRIRFKR